MRKLFLTFALLLAHAGAARAEAGAPPAAPAKPSKAHRAAAARGAKDQPRPDGKATAHGQAGEKGPPAGRHPEKPAEKPCEPVKPCPIE